MFPFVAKPSRSRLLLMALVGVAFILASASFAGIASPGDSRDSEWIGWLGMAFSGLSTAMLLHRAFENEDMLRIGPAGIWYRHWSDDVIPWREITQVGVWQSRGQKFILLNLVDPVRFPSSTYQGKAAGLNRALTGGDITVTLIGTDRTFDEAMAAIAEHRR